MKFCANSEYRFNKSRFCDKNTKYGLEDCNQAGPECILPVVYPDEFC